MIKLKTWSGDLDADVFVTQDGRSIEVVLYRDGIPIANKSFDGATVLRVKAECFRWLTQRNLTDESRLALSCKLSDCWDLLNASHHTSSVDPRSTCPP